MPVRLLKIDPTHLVAYSTTVMGTVTEPMTSDDAVEWAMERFSMSLDDARDFVATSFVEPTAETDPVRLELQQLEIGYWPKDPVPTVAAPGLSA